MKLAVSSAEFKTKRPNPDCRSLNCRSLLHAPNDGNAFSTFGVGDYAAVIYDGRDLSAIVGMPGL